MHNSNKVLMLAYMNFNVFGTLTARLQLANSSAYVSTGEHDVTTLLVFST